MDVCDGSAVVVLSWRSLLMICMMIRGSLLLATAPQRSASRVGSDLAHSSLKGADLQEVIASG